MSERTSDANETKDEIIREMIKAMKTLGAKSDLLGIVCSYGETYEDEEVLAELREWNSAAAGAAPTASER